MTTLEKILQDINSATDEYGMIDYINDEPVISKKQVKEIIKKHLSENDGWIPVEDGMPECEQEVFILTERGTETTALYEDGKMPESKSKWNWNDIQGEWDDKEDCMIIPDGWWEYRHFNPDDVYNNIVDEKVIAWRPLPEPYNPEKGCD